MFLFTNGVNLVMQSKLVYNVDKHQFQIDFTTLKF
jgi:hypothetical protein